MLEEQFAIIEKGEHMKKQDLERNYISSGVELLDTAIGGGIGHMGAICNLIGDSGSGKTVLATEIIYQGLKKFGKDVSVRYLDKESSYSFDTQSMYGFDMKDYFEKDVYSIQDFLGSLSSFCNKKKTKYGIYVVDSWDSLTSDEEIEELEKRTKDFEKGATYSKGSYDMERAKFSSKIFRMMTKTLEESNVLLIVISQIRDNVNAGMFGKKFMITGGKALKFYSTQRLFLKTVEEYTLEGRLLGSSCMVEAIKSRCKYPRRKTLVNFLNEVGVDAISTHTDYLYDLRLDYGKLKEGSAISDIQFKENSIDVNSDSLKEFLASKDITEEQLKEWITENLGGKATKKNILEFIKSDTALQTEYVEHFGVIDREGLIDYYINNDLEEEVAQKAVAKWLAIEERIKPNRKRKTL